MNIGLLHQAGRSAVEKKKLCDFLENRQWSDLFRLIGYTFYIFSPKVRTV